MEALENGLVRVFDLGSKLCGLYDALTGLYRSGFCFAASLEEILDLFKAADPIEVKT